jgi:hypothetical protein
MLRVLIFLSQGRLHTLIFPRLDPPALFARKRIVPLEDLDRRELLQTVNEAVLSRGRMTRCVHRETLPAIRRSEFREWVDWFRPALIR